MLDAGWFVIGFCGLGIGASQARGVAQASGYLSAVELSFEISFDGLKRCGYLVVGAKLRFYGNDMAEDALENYPSAIKKEHPIENC